MEVIAYKSSYKQYFAVFLSVMAAVLSIFFFFMKMLVWAIGLLAFCVIFIVAAIFWFRQPRELITLNNDMLEIYYGKETKNIALVVLTLGFIRRNNSLLFRMVDLTYLQAREI